MKTVKLLKYCRDRRGLYFVERICWAGFLGGLVLGEIFYTAVFLRFGTGCSIIICFSSALFAP